MWAGGGLQEMGRSGLGRGGFGIYGICTCSDALYVIFPMPLVSN